MDLLCVLQAYTYVPAGSFVIPSVHDYATYDGSLRLFFRRDTVEDSRLTGMGAGFGRTAIWGRLVFRVSGMVYWGFYELRGEKLFLGEEIELIAGIRASAGKLVLIPAAGLSFGSEMGPYLWDATEGEALYQIYGRGHLMLFVRYADGVVNPFLQVSMGSLRGVSIGVVHGSGLSLSGGFAQPSFARGSVISIEAGVSGR